MYVYTFIIFLPILLLLKCSSRRVAFVHNDVDMMACVCVCMYVCIHIPTYVHNILTYSIIG